jgi:glycosyltransferase involved in cell wall biosynthesis
MKPRICVLIPCYRNQAGLIRTCESLAHARGEFDVLIIDDGSPTPLQVADGAAGRHSVAVHRCPFNLGITGALNRGLELVLDAGYPLVARLDSGDTVRPDRFDLQTALLDAQQSLSMVGSYIDFCDMEGKPLFRFKAPLSNAGIARRMHIENCLVHSGVMMRTDAVQRAGGYRSACATSEDYDLFLRMMRDGEAAIVPEALTICEHNQQGISVARRHQQQWERLSLQVRNFAPDEITSYYGVVRTCTAMLIPQRAVVAAKRFVFGPGTFERPLAESLR